MFQCITCGGPYMPPDPRRKNARRFCSQACRMQKIRERRAQLAKLAAQRVRGAEDLLARFAYACEDGADPVVISALAREAKELLAI